MKLSICIPTFNRAHCLVNCLNSIRLNIGINKIDYEICISDNGSSDDTQKVVNEFRSNIKIKYFRFDQNRGRVSNYLKVIEIADGDFIWLLGDDDLLLPNALMTVCELIKANEDVDFFYINSFNLSAGYISSFPKPFDTNSLPENMAKFSTYNKRGKRRFLTLIDPSISFDFVGAMFLAVFKRKKWFEHVKALNQEAIIDMNSFSHFDNTFPHVKIFARAFSNSLAYFYEKPLTVNLSGEREWSPMSPLVNIVRLVEALDEYRLNGLSYFRYWYCKNFAYRTFWPDYMRIILRRKESGYIYIRPIKLLFNAMLFPYSWVSPVFYLIDLIKQRLKA